MYDNTIALVDESIETPALAAGSTGFWQDDSGNWWDVTVIDCEPLGWGWCTIQYGARKSIKSVPIRNVVDLDTRLERDSEYSAYELAEYRNRRVSGKLGYVYW